MIVCAPLLCGPCLFGTFFPRVTCNAGEEPNTGIVAGITPGNPTLVTCVEDDRLNFQVTILAMSI